MQFPEHLPLSQIQKGLKSGRYLQGNFMASRENYLEAEVGIQDEERMVGRHHRGGGGYTYRETSWPAGRIIWSPRLEYRTNIEW